MNIAKGYCHCGCGGKTKLASRDNISRGHIKGEPLNYIHGHNNPNRFKIGKKIHSAGYIMILNPSHPKADKFGYVFEHILVCEKVLGKHLPINAEPHHIDGNKNNNAPNNLIICQDRSYHMLLHVRTLALKLCGNVKYRKCSYCHQYDDLQNMYCYGIRHYRHRKCFNDYQRKRWQIKRIHF